MIKLAIGGDIPGFELRRARSPAETPSDIDDPSLGTTMLYTSGTTGRPKGVHRRPGADQPVVSGAAARVPMATAASQTCTCAPARSTTPRRSRSRLCMPLTAACGMVLMDGWDAEETLRLIEQHSVTHTHMVPTMFHRLLALPDDVRARYDCRRCSSCSTAPRRARCT